MPLLGFTMFKDLVLSGRKCQTIRKLRKHPIKVGDRLHLYWKLRTKECEKLGEATCTEVLFIAVTNCGSAYDDWGEINEFNSHPSQASQSHRLDEAASLDLAVRDGFESAGNLVRALVRMHKISPGSREFFQVIRWGRLEAQK